MKNFSDLLATDPNLRIEIQISPVVGNGAPDVIVSINDIVVSQGVLESSKTVFAPVKTLDPVNIKIVLQNKSYDNARETAVVVERIKIDDQEIIPRFLDQVVYDNDHDYKEPTNYLGFNGQWCLTIDLPFYQWLHQKTGQGWLLDPR